MNIDVIQAGKWEAGFEVPEFLWCFYCTWSGSLGWTCRSRGIATTYGL